MKTWTVRVIRTCTASLKEGEPYLFKHTCYYRNTDRVGEDNAKPMVFQNIEAETKAEAEEAGRHLYLLDRPGHDRIMRPIEDRASVFDPPVICAIASEN